jgi:hypothetical protein
MEDKSVGLKIRQEDRRLDWMRIPANFCIFRPGSSYFLRELNSFLLCALSNSVSQNYRNLWWLDQIALTAAFNNLSDEHRRKIRNLYDISEFDVIVLPPSGQGKAKSESWLRKKIKA